MRFKAAMDAILLSTANVSAEKVDDEAQRAYDRFQQYKHNVFLCYATLELVNKCLPHIIKDAGNVSQEEQDRLHGFYKEALNLARSRSIITIMETSTDEAERELGMSWSMGVYDQLKKNIENEGCSSGVPRLLRNYGEMCKAMSVVEAIVKIK